LPKPSRSLCSGASIPLQSEHKMKGTVLIIDDEKNVCESVAKVLRKEGYEPPMAADGN